MAGLENGVDTIAAVATPPGIGGIAVVRVSGPDSLELADRIFRTPRGQRAGVGDLQTHTIHYGHVVDDEGRKADEALLLVMKAPHTYTGEDVVEFDCHGGPVPVRAILGAALDAGARLAEPGEFTRRAFVNGRIDLSQAEAVADIIASRSRVSARLALEQLSGELGEAISDMRGRLLGLLASGEVVLDYPEMNLEGAQRASISDEVTSVIEEVEEIVETAGRGRPFREGVKTVIVGRPNVGKSSLLNALLRRERAIVTDVPGTTRDVVRDSISVDGIPLVISDTAGLRSVRDVVEREGVKRTKEAADTADLVLMIFDGTRPLSGDDEAMVRSLRDVAQNTPVIAVLNKIDLQLLWDEGALSALFERCRTTPARLVRISAKTREGLDDLKRAIAEVVVDNGRLPRAGVGIVITNVRHERALRRALEALEEARDSLARGIPFDLVGIDLREALEALGSITGESVTDDLLDKIFSDFCVGK